MFCKELYSLPLFGHTFIFTVHEIPQCRIYLLTVPTKDEGDTSQAGKLLFNLVLAVVVRDLVLYAGEKFLKQNSRSQSGYVKKSRVVLACRKRVSVRVIKNFDQVKEMIK